MFRLKERHYSTSSTDEEEVWEKNEKVINTIKDINGSGGINNRRHGYEGAKYLLETLEKINKKLEGEGITGLGKKKENKEEEKVENKKPENYNGTLNQLINKQMNKLNRTLLNIDDANGQGLTGIGLQGNGLHDLEKKIKDVINFKGKGIETEDNMSTNIVKDEPYVKITKEIRDDIIEESNRLKEKAIKVNKKLLNKNELKNIYEEIVGNKMPKKMTKNKIIEDIHNSIEGNGLKENEIIEICNKNKIQNDKFFNTMNKLPKNYKK